MVEKVSPGSRASSGPRCAVLIGTYLSGKTSLLDCILSRCGAVTRRGRVGDGNTVGDFSPEARARGMSNRSIYFGHALRNTLVPVITITGLQLGAIIAFAIITETVFQWPGMGLLFIQAVTFADIPVMAAYLCLIALIFVTINLIVDLLYFAVDPRLRLGKSGGH